MIYEVTITRVVTYVETIPVEADSKEEALEAGMEAAEWTKFGYIWEEKVYTEIEEL